MKHISDFRCWAYPNNGQLHSVTEMGRRKPTLTSIEIGFADINEPPDKPVKIKYSVLVKCERCGEQAVINQDGYVIEKHNSF